MDGRFADSLETILRQRVAPAHPRRTGLLPGIDLHHRQSAVVTAVVGVALTFVVVVVPTNLGSNGSSDDTAAGPATPIASLREPKESIVVEGQELRLAGQVPWSAADRTSSATVSVLADVGRMQAKFTVCSEVNLVPMVQAYGGKLWIRIFGYALPTRGFCGSSGEIPQRLSVKTSVNYATLPIIGGDPEDTD